jgi:hypothetical protein
LQDGTSAPETNFSRQPQSAVEVAGRRGAIAARGTFTPKFWTVYSATMRSRSWYQGMGFERGADAEINSIGQADVNQR